jgi:hypothetical protein
MDLLQLAALILPPVFAAGGAYMATRVTLRWHWHEIRRAHARIDRLEGIKV